MPHYSFMVLPEKVCEFPYSPSLLLGYPNKKGASRHACARCVYSCDWVALSN